MNHHHDDVFLPPILAKLEPPKPYQKVKRFKDALADAVSAGRAAIDEAEMQGNGGLADLIEDTMLSIMRHVATIKIPAIPAADKPKCSAGHAVDDPTNCPDCWAQTQRHLNPW